LHRLCQRSKNENLPPLAKPICSDHCYYHDRHPARADGPLLDFEAPGWLEPYKKQLWNPGGLATLAFLSVTGGILLSGDRKPKKGVMANAHWAGKTEKLAAHRVAIKQINERNTVWRRCFLGSMLL
jgi:hypothetical protein